MDGRWLLALLFMVWPFTLASSLAPLSVSPRLAVAVVSALATGLALGGVSASLKNMAASGAMASA